jgi:transposase
MQVIHNHCAGLDVHKASVVACVMITEPDGSMRSQTRTFGTVTAEILALGDWLRERQVTHVAMESTGVYWRPIHNLLEGIFELLVVNARHVQAVPGRKTDVKDAEWLGDLLRHGLLRGSFIPRARSGSCASSPATGPTWSSAGPKASTSCKNAWRGPTSNWPAWRRTSPG